MSRLALIAVGAAFAMGATLTVGACGYPDFVFNGTGGGCSLSEPITSCPSGQACSVVDTSTGQSACITPGDTANYAACSSASDCKAGSWCELSTNVCEPICNGTCAGACVGAMQNSTGTATIPGLDVCSASCDLVTASPCGAGATCTNIPTSGSDNITLCVKSGMVAMGQPCSGSQDCEGGGVCTEDTITDSTECSRWCSSEDDPCSGLGLSCMYFEDPSVDVDGHDYGYCG